MTKPKVLIVDDTPQNIHILMEVLKETCQILAATNGPKALELAGLTPQPDLILLDVMMPGMSGYEVCQTLKANPETANIPVIFVTALQESGDEEHGLDLGAVDFITKPFHPALIKARVHNHLELKKNRDHLEDEVHRRTEELVRANLARHKLEQELEVARRLQHSMLPNPRYSTDPEQPEVLAAVLRPARAVGGDLFDYVVLADGRLLVVIGDVSDKGVGAALFMVRALTLLRSYAHRRSSPAELLETVNLELCEDNDAAMFVTVSCMMISLESGEWSYASGGHEPFLWVSQDRVSFVELESGPALGLLSEATFPEHRGQLKAGERVLLYTDGLTDAVNSENEFWGDERFRQCVVINRDRPLIELVDRLIVAVDEFSAGCEQFDDMTLVALESSRREM